MTNNEIDRAIKTIRCNWPDEKYTMLKDALEKAICALEMARNPAEGEEE